MPQWSLTSPEIEMTAHALDVVAEGTLTDMEKEALVDSLTKTAHGRMRSDLEALQQEHARVQKELAAKYREEREKEELERKQRENEMAGLQLEEMKARKKRQNLFNGLLAALTTLVTALGTYFVAFKPKPPDTTKQTEELKATIATTKAEEKARLEKVERTQKDTARVILDQQVQIAESVELITDKIDAAHPRTAAQVKEEDYPAVGRAKSRAKKIREARGESLLHDEIETLLDEAETK